MAILENCVLARSSTIIHKSSGVSLQTPALIPSFSSKGFSLGSGQSEVGKILETASEFVTGAYLISAYDIARNYIPAPSDLPMKPDLIVLDSGGYEVSDEFDLSEVVHAHSRSETWSPEDLCRVLDNWPAQQPAIFVSYDNPRQPKPLDEQISDARTLFRGRENQLHCLLLKPATRTQTTLKEVIASATANASDFHSFDVIGVTEKALAASPQDRMVKIARLRRALDEANCKAPIHVFGSLDPTSICLYFLAGAELFDGLTWLRYAFCDGQCVYPHGYATLRHGIHSSDAFQRARIMKDNYYYLSTLEEALKDFLPSEDYSKLPHSQFMKDSNERLGRLLKGGQ